MAKDPADLLARGSDPLLENLRRALSQLHERTADVEATVAALRTGQSQSIDSLVAQITNNFSPLLTETLGLVEAIRDGDFITAEVLTPTAFVDGISQTLTLAPGSTFPFRPTSTLLLRRTASPDDYAFVRLDGWAPETRALSCTAFLAVGSPGPHDDVVVEIAALSTLAQVDMLAQAVAARDVATGAAGTAVPASSTAVSAAMAASDAADRAEAAALASQTWDPSGYYDKTAADSRFATAAQGALADGALQSTDVGTGAGDIVALDGSAKLPAVDGSQLTGIPTPAGVVTDTFTTSGTFTKDADDYLYLVECIGGGGSGGRHNSQETCGGGGGGYVSKILVAADVTSIVAVTVGAGGASQSGGTSKNGADGGASSFGAYLSAAGGKGGDGTNGSSGVGGRGGGGEAGGFNYNPDGDGGYSSGGGGGTYGLGGGCVMGGAGGGSSENMSGGSSVYGGNGGAGKNGANAMAGSAPGGGGGGSRGSSFASGAGARGEVRITRFKRRL